MNNSHALGLKCIASTCEMEPLLKISPSRLVTSAVKADPFSGARSELHRQPDFLATKDIKLPPLSSANNNYRSNMSAKRPTYTQDYIARIRYSNALPPPPCPPKLLDIPNTGLSSGQYTSAGFASRLAREQPLNIEADAELGMPIDLVGIPGVFDQDESGGLPWHPDPVSIGRLTDCSNLPS